MSKYSNKINNLFKNIPQNIPEEIFDTLVETKNLKIERIVSLWQATPLGQWLETEFDEWVILLKGRSKLLFKGCSKPVCLEPGDYILIPAFCQHRVEWTDPKQKTVWLALHYKIS